MVIVAAMSPLAVLLQMYAFVTYQLNSSCVILVSQTRWKQYHAGA